MRLPDENVVDRHLKFTHDLRLLVDLGRQVLLSHRFSFCVFVVSSSLCDCPSNANLVAGWVVRQIIA